MQFKNTFDVFELQYTQEQKDKINSYSEQMQQL